MNLDQFASRGLKAQQAVDELTQIENSNDVRWLKRIALDADRPVGARKAAEGRLRRLVKKPKL